MAEIMWPLAYRRIFGNATEKKKGTRIEEDAGGVATVAPSSGLGDFVPEQLKESRCPFFGMSFREGFLQPALGYCHSCAVADSIIGDEEASFGRSISREKHLCLFKRTQSGDPMWSQCPRCPRHNDRRGRNALALLMDGMIVFFPQSDGTEKKVPFRKWYGYCVKETKPA